MATKKDTIKSDDANTTSQIRMLSSDLDRINATKEKLKISQLEAVTLLLDNGVYGNLSDHDREKIHAAAKQANTTFEAICIAGALGYADRILSTTNKTDGKTADMRVNDYVTDLIKTNDAAKEWFEVKAITQGVISEGGFNRDAIKRYLAANKPKIDEHHAKHKIIDAADHNRKVATHFRMIANAEKREAKGG